MSNFKGKAMVNVREYYEKDGKSLPGKRGINMTIDLFENFLQTLPDLLSVLEEKGISMSLPKLDGGGKAAEKEEELPKDKKKPNFEATSDEEEDE